MLYITVRKVIDKVSGDHQRADHSRSDTTRLANNLHGQATQTEVRCKELSTRTRRDPRRWTMAYYWGIRLAEKDTSGEVSFSQLYHNAACTRRAGPGWRDVFTTMQWNIQLNTISYSIFFTLHHDGGVRSAQCCELRVRLTANFRLAHRQYAQEITAIGLLEKVIWGIPCQSPLFF